MVFTILGKGHRRTRQASKTRKVKKKYNYAKITDFIEKKDNNNLLRFPKYLAHELSNKLNMPCKIDTIRSILRKENYSPKIPQAVHVNKATLEEILNWQHSKPN